jgi:CMP-2-keto-3-deoxyoctulosonic acid synthetase
LGKNKSKNEKDEDIEVIRFLDNSMKVKMVNCIGNSIAVDTKEDLQEVKRILSKK